MVRSFYDNTEALVLDGLESIALLRPDISLDRATKSMAVHIQTNTLLLSGSLGC
jgi:dihydroxyacetone kinase